MLERALTAEVDEFLGRQRYARGGDLRGYRNGHQRPRRDRWFIRTYRLARRRRRSRGVAEDGAVGCTFDGCLYSGDRSHDAEAGIRASPCPHAADQPAGAGRPAFASVLAGRRHAPASLYSSCRLFFSFLDSGSRGPLVRGAETRLDLPEPRPRRVRMPPLTDSVGPREINPE